jgi:hypothetical protein
VRQQRRLETRQRTRCAIDVFRLEAVAARQEDLIERRVKLAMGDQRQQESAHELRVGEPRRVVRVAALDRQPVHKHRRGAAKQHVPRRRVLEPEPLVKRGQRQVQRQQARGVQHLGRPFVGVAGERQALVAHDRGDLAPKRLAHRRRVAQLRDLARGHRRSRRQSAALDERARGFRGPERLEVGES